MAIFSRKKNENSYLPPDEDLDELLRDFQSDIEALVEAILSGEQDVDLRLAELVEGAQSQQRIAIVEKLRAMVRERSAEKAEALDKALEAQKLLEHHQKTQLMERWLAYFMSQETLRKIRESLMANPGMKKQIEDAGQELARTGVLQKQAQMANKQELGELAANVQQGKDSGRGQGRGDR